MLRNVQVLECLQASMQVEQAGDDSSPARLMTGAQTSPVVTVEVLIKQDVVLPVRVFLERPGTAVYRASTILVAQEDPAKTAIQFLGDFEQRHVRARASWA